MNNAPYFGIKIRFTDKPTKDYILNIINKDPAYAFLNYNLNVLEAYHPKDYITIGLKNDYLNGEVIYAQNPKNGKFKNEIFNYSKEQEELSNDDVKAFGKLINSLVNENIEKPDGFWFVEKEGLGKIIHDIFSGITGKKAPKSESIITILKDLDIQSYPLKNPPAEHPIFNVRKID